MRAGGAVRPRVALNADSIEMPGTKSSSRWSYSLSARTRLRTAVSTPGAAGALSTDLELMRSVAATTDTRNEEIRTVLQAFIGRISSVPPSVWGGVAANRFKEVLDRWHVESTKLYHGLHSIAETIRYNEAML